MTTRQRFTEDTVLIARRDARMSCRKPVCRLNKQGARLNLDVGEFVEQRKVIEVEALRHQQNIFPGTRKKLIYICPERVSDNTPPNLERRMRHCVRGNYNAVWLHNPNQGAITTVQEDKEYTKTESTRHTTQA